ncbi:hypothetical protein BK708_04660 [Bacillus thuringiensis serovar yunnanensis]|nr:hypothetical protein BK708_04660 [Bacillus thuringiensis serovar yunnanensis]
MKRTSMYKVLATTAILGQTLVGPVLSHADTEPTNVGAHHQQQNTYDKKLKNFAFTNFAEEGEKDFKDKPKEAKDWIKEKVKEQGKKMSSSDTKALQDLVKKDNKEITEYLIKNKGGLVDKNPLNSKIEKLDTIFEEKATNIDTSMKVYMKLSDMKIEDLMQREDVAKVKGTILPRYGYTITSPTNVTGAIVELTVPKGSRVVYGKTNDSGELMIERGTGFLVTDVKEVTDKGVVRTKMEAKLLSNKEMKERESKLNEVSKSLSDTMKMPVSLEFSNAETTASIEKARKGIAETNTALESISKIIPTFNVSGLLKKLTVEGVHINIKDSSIEPGKQTDGRYIPTTKELVLNTTRKVIDTNTPLHELGHAIDHIFFGFDIKKDPKFQQIVSAELQSFLRSNGWEWDPQYVDYYSKPVEYWAEAFARFMTNNENLKKEAPKTYQYIIDKLKELSL